MSFLYIKALHIIFVVTWFSGMFYLARLYVYNREALDKPQLEREVLQAQFNIMIQRLLMGITIPSAILTLIFGTLLLLNYNGIPSWLHLKLGFVFLLYLYQASLYVIYKQQKSGIFKHSPTQLRLWNEVPTLFLVSIIMLVVVRDNISLLYGLIGLVLFTGVLLFAIRVYKKLRER